MIYKDSIGNYQSKCMISHFGGQYGKGGYLSLGTSAINNPHDGMRWDNTPEKIALIAPWAAANGYVIIESKDDYGAYQATLTHRETELIASAQAKKTEKVFAGAERGYIRYGDIPAGGYSRNAATGELEKGVSVFYAEYAKNGEYRPLPKNNQQLGSLLTLIADKRPVYRVRGTEVGTGGDGEPVLKIKQIERIEKIIKKPSIRQQLADEKAWLTKDKPKTQKKAAKSKNKELDI